MAVVDICSRPVRHKLLSAMKSSVAVSVARMCRMAPRVAQFSFRSLNSQRPELAPEVRTIRKFSAETVKEKRRKRHGQWRVQLSWLRRTKTKNVWPTTAKCRDVSCSCFHRTFLYYRIQLQSIDEYEICGND